MTSLRARLAAGTALAVTLVLVVAGGTLSLLVERRLVAEVDRSLVARAQLLASAVEVEGLRVEIEFEELDVSGLRAGGDELLEVWHGEQSLYRSKSLGDTSWIAPRP